jgi:hypothetical protein
MKWPCEDIEMIKLCESLEVEERTASAEIPADIGLDNTCRLVDSYHVSLSAWRVCDDRKISAVGPPMPSSII